MELDATPPFFPLILILILCSPPSASTLTLLSILVAAPQIHSRVAVNQRCRRRPSISTAAADEQLLLHTAAGLSSSPAIDSPLISVSVDEEDEEARSKKEGAEEIMVWTNAVFQANSCRETSSNYTTTTTTATSADEMNLLYLPLLTAKSCHVMKPQSIQNEETVDESNASSRRGFTDHKSLLNSNPTTANAASGGEDELEKIELQIKQLSVQCLSVYAEAKEAEAKVEAEAKAEAEEEEEEGEEEANAAAAAVDAPAPPPLPLPPPYPPLPAPLPSPYLVSLPFLSFLQKLPASSTISSFTRETLASPSPLCHSPNPSPPIPP